MTSVFPLLLSNWLNLSVYDRNIFGFSSVVFGNLRKIFGSVRVMSGNVRLTFGKILENLRKSSESDRNSSEIRQIRRHQHVYIIKRTLHVSSNFMFSWQELNSSCHSNIKSISSRHRVISSMYLTPEHPIIDICNNTIQNGRRIGEKVYFACLLISS